MTIEQLHAIDSKSSARDAGYYINSRGSIEEAEAWTRAVRPPANIVAFRIHASSATLWGSQSGDIAPEPLPERVTVNVDPALTPAQIREIEAITHEGRGATIRAIRSALLARSGKPWSVTGSTGTAYGWLTIDAQPKRRMSVRRVVAGQENAWPLVYEVVNTGEPGHYINAEDVVELAALLGVDSIHDQGYSVSPGRWKAAICRAKYGHAGPFVDREEFD